MQFDMMYVPTTDLEASLELFRSLGFTEVWREGDTTAAVVFPGNEVQMMLDMDLDNAPAGPMLTVDSVNDFHASRPEKLTSIHGPSVIPGGFWASYRVPGGATVYVVDQSTDQE
jgi:hypothetical protein